MNGGVKMETITIKEYLTRKGIPFREAGSEIITHCVFRACDDDSRQNEAHLYFNAETSQYDCKKCGEKGNIITLAKHFGDLLDDIALHPRIVAQKKERVAKITVELVEKYHKAMLSHIKQSLQGRGIEEPFINAYNLGYGQFYGKSWITIPIRATDGNYAFFKLRQNPAEGNDKITYPKGAHAQLYDWETIKETNDLIVICEGELDRLLLTGKGIPAITSTHGAMTFKPEWIDEIKKCRKIYICFDNDDAGRKGTTRIAKMLDDIGHTGIHVVSLPEEVGEGGDVTDYFVKFGGAVDDLLKKFAKPYPERVDVSRFTPITTATLIDTLGLAIKRDEENKVVTFLCELAAYTENAQFNVSYNAPSSTGKSYIPTEIAKLFPQEDVMELAYCSPTAFFHDAGEFNKELNGYKIDLSRKILIFLDQPHNDLLARLRPLLSHDKKEISLKITDKSQKHGLRTKNILIKGYPSVIFCTAGLNIDEQEATRFLLLSPEINQEKIREGVLATIRKEADQDRYTSWLKEDDKRQLLIERIKAIRNEKIQEIKISCHEEVERRFFAERTKLKPRHQRDVKRITSLIKCFALLNLWWRERNGSTIIANEKDIEEAFKIWEKISASQELNLPPYIYDLYRDIILKAWENKNSSGTELGLTRQDISKKHYEVYGRMLDTTKLRQQILPMLETAGLISQEPDPNDKRKMLIYPTVAPTVSTTQEYSESDGGVPPEGDQKWMYSENN